MLTVMLNRPALSARLYFASAEARSEARFTYGASSNVSAAVTRLRGEWLRLRERQ